jgi:hypothetical protein
MQYEFAMLSTVTCPAVPYISTLCHHKRHDLRGGGRGLIAHKMCVWIFSTPFFLRNISHTRKTSLRCDKKCILSSCKVPVIFVRC